MAPISIPSHLIPTCIVRIELPYLLDILWLTPGVRHHSTSVIVVINRVTVRPCPLLRCVPRGFLSSVLLCTFGVPPEGCSVLCLFPFLFLRYCDIGLHNARVRDWYRHSALLDRMPLVGQTLKGFIRTGSSRGCWCNCRSKALHFVGLMVLVGMSSAIVVPQGDFRVTHTGGETSMRHPLCSRRWLPPLAISRYVNRLIDL